MTRVVLRRTDEGGRRNRRPERLPWSPGAGQGFVRSARPARYLAPRATTRQRAHPLHGCGSRPVSAQRVTRPVRGRSAPGRHGYSQVVTLSCEKCGFCPSLHRSSRGRRCHACPTGLSARDVTAVVRDDRYPNAFLCAGDDSWVCCPLQANLDVAVVGTLRSIGGSVELERPRLRALEPRHAPGSDRATGYDQTRISVDVFVPKPGEEEPLGRSMIVIAELGSQVPQARTRRTPAPPATPRR